MTKELFYKYNGDVNLIAKQIRKDLKATFGNTAKFSVRISRYSLGQSINIKIKEIDDQHCYKDKEEAERKSKKGFYEYDFSKNKYVKDEVIEQIRNIHRKYNYDESDPMIDYFNVGYYGEFSCEAIVEK